MHLNPHHILIYFLEMSFLEACLARVPCSGISDGWRGVCGLCVHIREKARETQESKEAVEEHGKKSRSEEGKKMKFEFFTFISFEI